MKAILLAAGVGRRLRPYTEDRPKCLLPFKGKTLLDRHLDALEATGVHEVIMVLGHCGDQIRAAVAQRPDAARVQFLENTRYTEGSILSLHTAIGHIDDHADGAIVMDADVLYPRELMRRLVQTPGTAFLVDETSLETGEEMTVGIKDGRVRTIDRFVGDGWDLKGETVGFTKFAAEDAPELRRQMDACLAEGLTKAEYEAAIIRMLKTCPGRYALVGDLPWTEIDFDADVEKAKEMLPEIEAVDAKP